MSRGLASLLLLAAASASAADLDATRAAWRYRRDVQVAPRDGFAALAIPPELRAHAASDLRDLRLVDQGGADVPYVVDRRGERVTARVHPGTLVDTRREPVGAPEDAAARASWTVDLGEPRTFDTLALQVAGDDFAKHLRVEASADLASWRLLRDDAPVFSRPWQGRVRHTVIALDAPETARYLRLTTRDDRQSPAVEVTGLTASWVRRAEGETWSRAAVVTLVSRGRVSRYRVEVPPGLPIETVTIDADDPAFARRVALVEVAARAGQEGERVAADAPLYRVRLPEDDLSGEQRTLTVAQAPTGALFLDVHDGDSPPLRGLRASVSGTATRLVFAASVAPVALYYGNDVTRAAVYDLAALSARLAATRDLAEAQIGPERANAAFARPAPLALGGLRGAAVDPKRWRFARTLATQGPDDLYVTTLAPSDLGRLRADVGDLRVVDDAGRQVPYILEESAAEVPVPLEVEPLADGPGGRVSRYRLRAAAGRGGERPALPLHGLALDVPEPFFDRRVRVLVSGESKRRGTLADAAVQRRLRPGASEPSPVRLEWAPTFARELELEVDEGDNAPLTLAGVQGLVRVPRLTFPAGAGVYRVLLGNPEAERPRYDLAALRAEVLAFSAVPVVPQDAVPNGAYRRGVGEYFRDAPPTLVLWGTLVLAVAGLGWLTARVLRHPPAGPPPPDDAV
ncbi:MAG: DUF3999 family protein [Vicinamibacteria bacterium]